MPGCSVRHRAPASEMKTCLLLAVLASLFGCSPSEPRLSPKDRHFARSDDLGEYSGLYLYTLAPDGVLRFTNYPHKPGAAVTQEIVGQWQEEGGTLVWRMSKNDVSITYLRNAEGVYMEQDGGYYVPVELRPVQVRDGMPLIE